MDFIESLRLQNNYSKVQRAGNSVDETGQFLFNTFDNRLVAKSISFTEMKVIRNSLKEYRKHIDNNSRTLLSKIYCLLTINFTQLNSSQNIVLMEGLGKVPDECVLSAYNLLKDTKHQ